MTQYKLVPVEPTPEMLKSAVQRELVDASHYGRLRDTYICMLAAAPQPSAEPVALLHDDGYWTAAKTDAGRRLSERLLFAGSPSIAVYTAPQPAKSAEQCWKCGDLDPAGHAKCNVPACGMREDTQPARREPLTRDQVKELMKPDYDTASMQERADFMTGFRAAEAAHGIGEQV